MKALVNWSKGLGSMASTEKDLVRDFWNAASCGERLYLDGKETSHYEEQARRRYELEPYIIPFAGFAGTEGLRVLEIGVGLGADHERFARSGAILTGIDITDRAVAHVRHRLALGGLRSDLRIADAESLPFADASFDRVYSWGVLHHTPDTPKAFSEVLRVLEPGGEARIMIYHTWSIVGYMLWLRYALLRLKPFTSLQSIYARYLESPGTKTYTVCEARKLMAGFEDVRIETVLTHGDLLSSSAGQRHRGPLLAVAKALWPRWLIRLLLPTHGLFMMMSGRKPCRSDT